MKLSKVKIELVVIVLLIIVGLGAWWFVATKDARFSKSQYKQMVRVANRQAVEIAIIEQGAKLRGYKQQIATAQQAQRNAVKSFASVPLGPSVVNPVDPVDVTLEK